MTMRTPFSTGEWYHCFGRGVDKRRVFLGASDYERFLLSIFIGNSSQAIHVSNLRNKKLAWVLSDTTLDRGKPIVEVGAYCLMPNHFHIMLKEIIEGGIALFMQKILTGYTMYFNKKNERAGALFSGTFKSQHVGNDAYLKHLVSYIHLNPAELFEPKWKTGMANIQKLERSLRGYRYSSLPAFIDSNDYTRQLLGPSVFELFDSLPDFREMLVEANAYYQETNIKVKP